MMPSLATFDWLAPSGERGSMAAADAPPEENAIAPNPSMAPKASRLNLFNIVQFLIFTVGHYRGLVKFLLGT